jgi:hypothetical protein
MANSLDTALWEVCDFILCGRHDQAWEVGFAESEHSPCARLDRRRLPRLNLAAYGGRRAIEVS